jgi:hypothetical protein
MMGAAIGFITSDPMPLSQRIGIRLARTAHTVELTSDPRPPHNDSCVIDLRGNILAKRARLPWV